ncbi:hypothetical protein ACHAWF_018070 [Thalassiosira exigua]
MKANEPLQYILLVVLLLAYALVNHAGRSRGEMSDNLIQSQSNGVKTNDELSIVGEEDANHPIKSIRLIGERHSGTTWITEHLEECFGDQIEVKNKFTRFKHWFQVDAMPEDQHKSMIVVAMFRDPYDWVDSMRTRPYHSPLHFDLDWREFVTTPWVMPRGRGDSELLKSGLQHNASCQHLFSFDEIVPCSPSDRKTMFNGTWHGKKVTVGVNYELNHDGSGQPYQSILDLRADKIRNFLSVEHYRGVAAHLAVQYEFLLSQGTNEFIREIEGITGLKAKCPRAPPRPLRSKDLDEQFIAWLDDHLDWEAEKMAGYSPRK